MTREKPTSARTVLVADRKPLAEPEERLGGPDTAIPVVDEPTAAAEPVEAVEPPERPARHPGLQHLLRRP